MSEAPRRILVIGPSWVGDMVMAQSLFMALKAADPAVDIDVLAPGWSLPILAQDGKVLGTFGFYYRNTRGPSAVEHNLVAASVHLCAIAIERDQRRADRRRLAETDALTGLPNRRQLIWRAERALSPR